MKFSPFFPALLGLICLSSVTRNADAAIITWGAATTISGDTNVSTYGTLDRAINIGGTANVTVNGVNFLSTGTGGPQSSFVVQNTTFSDSPGSTTIYRGAFFSNANAPFTGLSTNYQSLLSSAAYNSGTAMTVSLGSLTAGQGYQVQVWVNDSRATGRTETLASGANTVGLDFNNTNGNGGVGQFVIGSFIADSANQAFTITGQTGQSSQINALQLRAVPTPEPSTYAMMILGCVAMCVLAAKRKKDADLPA